MPGRRFRRKRRIFVFGSNREGRHGRGAALEAVRKHGAMYGKARGLHGDSYAIVTKELRPDMPPVALTEIAEQVAEFIQFAESRPTWKFVVTQIGCGLAGFSPQEIAPLFEKAVLLRNVSLPMTFWQVLRPNLPTPEENCDASSEPEAG